MMRTLKETIFAPMLPRGKTLGEIAGRLVTDGGRKYWEVSAREYARIGRLIAPLASDYIGDCYAIGNNGGRAYIRRAPQGGRQMTAAARALGRAGGKKGGKSKSARKLAASAANLAKARAKRPPAAVRKARAQAAARARWQKKSDES